MITDGEPTDMKPRGPKCTSVVSRINEEESSKKFLFFTVGVEPANMQTLKELSLQNRPLPGTDQELQPVQNVVTWYSTCGVSVEYDFNNCPNYGMYLMDMV